MKSLLRSKSAEVSMDIRTTITKESQDCGVHILVKDFIAYGAIYRNVLEAVQDQDFEWKE